MPRGGQRVSGRKRKAAIEGRQGRVLCDICHWPELTCSHCGERLDSEESTVHIDPALVPRACHDLFFCVEPCALAYLRDRVAQGDILQRLEQQLRLRCPWPLLAPAPGRELLRDYGGTLSREQWRQHMADTMDPGGLIGDLASARLHLLERCAAARGAPVIRRAATCDARRRVEPLRWRQERGAESQNWRQRQERAVPALLLLQAQTAWSGPVWGSGAAPGGFSQTLLDASTPSPCALSPSSRAVGAQRSGGGKEPMGFELLDSEMGMGLGAVIAECLLDASVPEAA